MSHPSARAVALEAIGRVIDDGAYSNRLLPSLLARSGLDTRDRAFAMELAFGTLRRRPRLDAAIERVAHRSADRITPPRARHALRLGAYQLLATDVPAHAAVSETVDLVPGRARGFVNAVLRRLAADPPPEPTGDGAAAVAERTGLSAWAVEELQTVLGPEHVAAAEAFAAKAPLSLRVIGGPDRVPSMLRELAAAGVEGVPGAVDPACIAVAGGAPRTFPGFAEGRLTVQDQASAFVVEALAPEPGERVYDACAAPGGKTVFAWERVGGAGLVVGADISPRRVDLIAASARRLHASPSLLAQDATTPAVDAAFDRVLVDAPCSGIGSARRRPELLWRVPRERVGTLAARQLAIASASAGLLAPGGRLVYAVCTFPRAETDAVCDALLRGHGELQPVATEGPDGPAERHRLWPHRHGCDGMFVAAFRRVS
jgi:16S rRNA (cytosine967-C5)-methyltransferase